MNSPHYRAALGLFVRVAVLMALALGLGAVVALLVT